VSPVMTVSTTATKSLVERARSWLSPLNLHFAGIGLLVLVNIYLLVHMAFLWRSASNNNADAVNQQKIALKTAEVAAQPLRGLDAKLELATADADRFYRQRLPGSDSEWAAELGTLTKKQNVRYVRGTYVHKAILARSAGELTQVQIDASLSGDYRPLVQFINSLERDKMFFVIDSVTLTGQQSGTVNLKLGLRTFLRGHVPQDDTQTKDDDTTSATTPADKSPSPTTGGPTQ
jgi:type IV pilus assembly protein PilO